MFPPARKRLGQHFLTDPNIVRKILSLAQIEPWETVVEIGPGRGALTTLLCRAAQHVIALEVDPELVSRLEQTLGTCPNLDLRRQDALTFPYDTLPASTVVVANLPYNISTPLLFRLLEAGGRLARLVLMLQREVAERLVAGPGSPRYGVLSVLAQYRADITLAFLVSPQCFRPRPDVESAVVRLDLPKAEPIGVHDEQWFGCVVRGAFAHRRKTLLNSLRDEGIPHDSILAGLAHCGISPARRAETLSLHDFARLSTALAPTADSAKTRNA